MTVQSPTRRPVALPPWVIPAAVTAIFVTVGVLLRPNLALLADIPLVIKIHLGAAVAAFFLGVVMLSSRKGRTFHRRAGWLWVGLMAVVAGSSLFITEIFKDHWSPIHILSGLTLLGLPLAVMAARKHDVKKHRARMMGLFFGGMVVAGGFTFLPGRLMWQVFFG